MRPCFHPRLINGPYDDPGLFVPFLFQKRAVIFDLGDIGSLPAKDILKISHAFVTHTHMDHFIGFDRLLRLFLGRAKQLNVYGPKGFLKNAEGKLAGYAWNLVENYNYHLSLNLTEIRSENLITKEYHCRNQFLSSEKALELPFDAILHEEAAFSVSGVLLDHSIPCLGYSLHERFHVNIVKEGLVTLGLETGPWLSRFKQALYSQTDPNSKFEVQTADRPQPKTFCLGELTEQIARITSGQKITYIADVLYSEANNRRIVEFAKNSDHLFLEAAFLERDHEIAKKRYHLTARQAGELAARAGVKRFTIFHFSPRYTRQKDLLYQEAAEAYNRLISSQ